MNYVLLSLASVFLTGSFAFTAPQLAAAPPEYAELLGTYVTSSGVRYGDWNENAKDLERLSAVVEFYATTTPPENRDDALAWHLNAYNAWILNNILAKYPTKGPLSKEPLFFHGRKIVISGKKTSFDKLEQKVIRPTFKEPRIHFALNCASESCPPLIGLPFTAASLDADLDTLTRAFVNKNPQGVAVAKDGKTVKLSKIFDWYADDFGGKDKVVAFINRYRETPLPAKAEVKFMDYSWKLNAAR